MINNLQSLLDYDARKFVIAEVQLKQILPVWIKNAGSLKLKTVLQKYHDLSVQHIDQMQHFLEEEQISSLSTTNRIMQAFIDETEEKSGNCCDPASKDACLLAAVQSINHFKISMYGTAAAFAKALEMKEAAVVFHEAEINEKQIDARLTKLAEEEINVFAKAPIELPG